MAELPTEVVEAIKKAVADAGQPAGLGDKLITWLGALMTGRESLKDTESVIRHVGVLYETVEVDEPHQREEGV